MKSKEIKNNILIFLFEKGDDLQMNYEAKLKNILKGNEKFSTDKKLIQILGKDLADFITYLLEQSNFYETNDFPCTNLDVYLFSGMRLDTITQCKKRGKEKGLFKTIERNFPKITHYSLNYEKIYELLKTSKSIEELAYERLFREKVDSDFLRNLGFRKLWLICKKEGISYTGNDNKETLIQKILGRNFITNLKSTMKGSDAR